MLKERPRVGRSDLDNDELCHSYNWPDPQRDERYRYCDNKMFTLAQVLEIGKKVGHPDKCTPCVVCEELYAKAEGKKIGAQHR